MNCPAADAGFVAGPGAVIAAIVSGAEPALGEDDIAAAIVRAAPSRAQQRRLAAALTADPGLLTSGRPEGPPQVELLIMALRGSGAERLALPRCAGCGQPRRLVQRDGRLRICTSCDHLRRGAAEPCVICGDARKVCTRDRDGQPRCDRCRPWDDPDPVARIAAHVSRLGPGPDRLRLAEVIREAIPRPFQRHQVLWELDRRPGLLTGEGARGRSRGPCLPFMRPDGALESQARLGALLPSLLRAGQARGLQPLPAARPGGQPDDRRRAGLQQMLPQRSGQPPAVRRLRADHPGPPPARRPCLVPPLLPRAAGHLLALRPRKALLPRVLGHAAVRELLTANAPRPLCPLRPQAGRMGANR